MVCAASGVFFLLGAIPLWAQGWVVSELTHYSSFSLLELFQTHAGLTLTLAHAENSRADADRPFCRPDTLPLRDSWNPRGQSHAETRVFG